MERLLRRLLNYPNKPAVILLNAFAYTGGFPFRGAFWGGSVERDTPDLALYYDLPALSVKGCCYHLMRADVPGYRVDNQVRWLPPDTPLAVKSQYFYMDNVHPFGTTGHRQEIIMYGAINMYHLTGCSCRAMGDLLAFFLRHAYTMMQVGMWHFPTNTDDALPEPMIPGNFESKGNNCYVFNDVQKIVQVVKVRCFKHARVVSSK
jgi:hypothetical protein